MVFFFSSISNSLLLLFIRLTRLTFFLFSLTRSLIFIYHTASFCLLALYSSESPLYNKTNRLLNFHIVDRTASKRGENSNNIVYYGTRRSNFEERI